MEGSKKTRILRLENERMNCPNTNKNKKKNINEEKINVQEKKTFNLPVKERNSNEEVCNLK